MAFDGAEAGARIVERSAGGEAAVWGTVTRWEPPSVVAFSWHPGHPADRASQVEVTFTPAAPGRTMVRLEHTGWDVLRLPGPGRLGTATRLANEDDASVAGGFFTVAVRPWQVVMQGA